jgi:hypothetical protein
LVNPTGIVKFGEAVAATCPLTFTQVGAPTVGNPTTVSPSFSAPSTAGVTFWLIAQYVGDNNNAGFFSPCEGPFTTTAATPVIATQATANAAVGSPITDLVTLTGLSGQFPSAQGTVIITAQLGSCTGAGVFSTAVLLNAGNTVGGVGSVTGTFTPSGPPANYFWSAAFVSLNGNNNSVVEACQDPNSNGEESTVGQVSSGTITQVIVDSTGNPPTGLEPSGTSFHDTAVVSGGTGAATPTGTVTYNFYANGSCSGSTVTSQNVTIVSGLVPNSASTGPLAAGSYSYCVSYGGDANNVSSSSLPEPFTVNVFNGTLTITTTRLPGGNHGRSYSASISTSGGVAPLHYSLSAVGAGQRVPPGLGINANTGVISGVAGATGTYVFTVTVTDSGNPHQTVSKTLSVTIS